MIFTKGKIVQQEIVATDYMLLSIEQAELASKARPGQFVMLKAWERRDLVLPRPFSLYRILPQQGQMQILYKIRGKGTAEMAQRQPGDEVELIGPSGNGVTLPEKGSIALLGRGIGAAPLMAVGEAAAVKGLEVYTFLSARNRALILGRDDFARCSRQVVASTDDGQENGGRLLTDLLADLLAQGVIIHSVYTCGSKRLAKGLNAMQGEHAFTAYVFLEEVMACGIGSCKGCVCKIVDSGDARGYVYKKVCQDGPVFPVDKVVW